MKIIAAVANTVAGLMFLLGLIMIAANYQLLFQRLFSKRGERQPSMVPFAGGVLCSLALYMYLQVPALPRQIWSWWILLPLALDPGGAVFMAAELSFTVAAQTAARLAAALRARRFSKR